MKSIQRISVIFIVLTLVFTLPLQVFAADAPQIPDGLEQEVVDALTRNETKLWVSKYRIESENWSKIYYSILDKHPELWYVDRRCSWNYSNGIVTMALFSYLDTDQVNTLRGIAREVVSKYTYSWMSDAEKALALHDYLALNCEYDLSYTRYDAYSALVYGSAVCQGYAEAYRILLSEAGIPSMIVSSDPMNHAWNVVEIGGSWYHVDVTWDDPVSDVEGRVDHAHFLRSDAGITQEEHYGWESSVACTSAAFDSGTYWSGTDSAVIYLADGTCILRYDSMGSVRVEKRGADDTTTTLYQDDTLYYDYQGGRWKTVTRGITLWQGNLYFGDLMNMYVMPLSGGEAQKIFSLSDVGGGHCFAGSHVSDGKVYVTVRDQDTGATNERTYTLANTEHTHSYITAVTQPTCTEPGTAVYTCACGESYTETTPALGHTPVEVPAVAPTCTQSGSTAGEKCQVCDTVTVAIQTVPPTGHIWDAGVITVQPTVTAEGVKTYTCTVCSEIKTEVLPVHTHSYEGVVSQPTCTKPGYTAYTCACGESYLEAGDPPKGHSYGLWIIDTESVLNGAAGTKHRVCECGETETATYTNPLVDVPNGKYFSKPIFWAYENGITKGKTATEFQRDVACTRKQIVTFLWRAAGCPEPASMENPFTDVKNDQFEKAILWAYYFGITKGTSATEFSPENPCTRKQIVMFLWRFNECPEPASMENPFEDVKRGDQFEKAILWALGEGVTTGKTETTFQPDEPCTRGQIVTFLYRSMVKE